ncbi:MAG: hypothetical protein KatS3mg110_1101 [Pirellulaceae bacterium]|nr:MAG: hypothetical protein KatS3mg110_1101 [Pirellulaceae bacterium]
MWTLREDFFRCGSLAAAATASALRLPLPHKPISCSSFANRERLPFREPRPNAVTVPSLAPRRYGPGLCAALSSTELAEHASTSPRVIRPYRQLFEKRIPKKPVGRSGGCHRCTADFFDFFRAGSHLNRQLPHTLNDQAWLARWLDAYLSASLGWRMLKAPARRTAPLGTL